MSDKMREAIEDLKNLMRHYRPGASMHQRLDKIKLTMESALTQQPEIEPIYQVWFSKGQWTDVPKKVYDRAEGSDRARVVYACPQPSAQVPEGRADEIVTQLYRRFKDWSKRGFGPDDVTWCEVKANVIELLTATPSIAEKDE